MVLAICQLWESLEGTDHFSLHRNEETFRVFADAREKKDVDATAKGEHYWCEVTSPDRVREINIVEAVIVFHEPPPPPVIRH